MSEKIIVTQLDYVPKRLVVETIGTVFASVAFTDIDKEAYNQTPEDGFNPGDVIDNALRAAAQKAFGNEVGAVIAYQVVTPSEVNASRRMGLIGTAVKLGG